MRRVSVALGCIVALACSSNPRPSGEPAGQRHLSNLSFDSDGADFTDWISEFTEAVYRSWVVPQAAAGARGRVDVEFEVDREGNLGLLRVVGSSGTSSLDDAAESALTRARLSPLPRDYRRKQVTIRVSFLSK